MSPSEQYTWFITGTSRGIGLELTKQLLQSPHNVVVAACRNPGKADSLQSLTTSAGGRLYIVRLDVTDTQTIKDAAQETAKIVGEKGIDYLINNAGIVRPSHFQVFASASLTTRRRLLLTQGIGDTAFTMDIDDLTKTLQTNLVGPAYTSQAFISLVEKSKKKTIVNISSTLGSIGRDFGPQYASYAVTKASLNMLTYKQAKERPDLTVLSICPGHLQTDMGGENAALPVSVGVAGVLKVVTSLTPKDSGSFMNFRGERVPW
ncbi:NAD(P)-binding protein [Dichomitus squalens LYAD-421 SS1]|uniref:NAD(P)-binding protein n=1 Tax=Dichomitus squalens (strain LYAD-421) TaxID=732165 RepID=R7SQH2_DICSQ|nr:NAD(P)-binding protein [Dichomitus squalens LYAD-421 SS1]EJF58336.1 NAD(P)-binding protein [Dichomitus squalens LYAD-421 SS1]